ncbi:NAD(P)-binding protein [Coniochaeta ligniaria NRRL 30616]|uniref:NAD(P)-binding protein n=1 Tax=Coniochaeta ligniaria NRRL 30616 TaxID=1408157 RepID=A0A1J7J2K8_9PEZI|nr:NAD(P)-binding protein [Coniochaeta ligniaria NRRL 30616]
MASAAKKIVVCGGNGFLGSRICKFAVARGWDVTSISRSGEPHWSTATSSPTAPSWSQKVSWQRADILKPATYSPLLKDADYVIHSMGILLEADYKGVVSGRQNPISALQKAFSSAPRPSANPLERGPAASELKPPAAASGAAQLTYEVMNRDSAILLAKLAAEQGASAFCYVSAAGGAPVLPTRYITTKREAEEVIAREFPGMRGVFVRPPIMYDSARPVTVAAAAATAAGALLNGVTGGVLKSFMGSAGVKPLKVDVVAQAVVEALSDESVRGPVEVPELEALAAKSWRKTML